MKNKITILTALFILLTVGFGCSVVDQFRSGGTNTPNVSNSNTATVSNTNTADPNAVAKTGVAECDELIDILDKDRQNPEDGFIARKVREVAIDLAKETIKTNIEQNQGDKVRIAQGCREAKNEYMRSRTPNSNQEQPNTQSGNTQNS